MKFTAQGLILSVVLSVFSPVFAHHSLSANYDVRKISTIQGVVTGFSFRNPHVRVNLEVSNSDGTTSSWVSEGSAASILRREGWTSETLQAGQLVKISGVGTHDGSPMVSMNSVALLNADGSIAQSVHGMTEDFSKTYDAPLVELPFELAQGIPNLSGVWGGQGSPYAPPRAPSISFNDAGLAVLYAYSNKDDPQVFCDTPGLIRQAGQTPHSIRISQYEDRVVFEYEEYGIEHEVYFDPPPTSGVKTHFGDSVARYEDGALVVETINLLSELIVGGGHRLSDQATVVQTYTRVDEPGYSSLLKIKTVAKDPLYLVEDFELINIKMAATDYDFISNGCVPPPRQRNTVHPAMNIFITSVGLGGGANLAEPDAHCAALAGNVSQGDKNWRGFPSTSGIGTNGEDGISTGPWYNAKGDLVAVDLQELEASRLNKEVLVSERAQIVDRSSADDLFYCFAENRE